MRFDARAYVFVASLAQGYARKGQVFRHNDNDWVDVVWRFLAELSYNAFVCEKGACTKAHTHTPDRLIRS